MNFITQFLVLALFVFMAPSVSSDPSGESMSEIIEKLTLGNDFFLSRTNPMATVDQRDMEALAIDLLAMPEVQRAKESASQRWRTIVGARMTAEAEALFDSFIDEWAYNYAMKAVNSDPNYPKVLGNLYSPPHEWFGMQVPGSRASGGDGTDQNYILIPIDGSGKYELIGRRFDNLGDVPFALMGSLAPTITLNALNWQDVKINSDDTFVITLDPEPANGRPNHIQTDIDARWLFIRDCRNDWRQKTNAYRVKRLNAPTAPPLTIEQMARRAANYMIEDVPALNWFMRVFYVLEDNEITEPFGTGGIGGLVAQKISLLHLKLEDDEAYVATFGAADAPFRDIVLQDFWFRSIDYWKKQTSMNISQGVPNPDGSTTYVISKKDPGIHNWLDTTGLKELLVVHRWQGLKKGAAPWAKGKVVKLKDLEDYLPEDMKRVTARERKQQITERMESFKTRFAYN